MILGKVRRGFFQEQILLLELAVTTAQFGHLGPFRDGGCRLLAGMLPTVSVNPVAKSSRVNTELLGHLGDRPRGLNNRLFVPEVGV